MKKSNLKKFVAAALCCMVMSSVVVSAKTIKNVNHSYFASMARCEMDMHPEEPTRK